MVVTGDAVDFGGFITGVGQLGLWLQAIGVAVVIVIVFDVVSFIYNRKKLRKLEALHEKMERLEKKIDKVIKQTE